MHAYIHADTQTQTWTHIHRQTQTWIHTQADTDMDTHTERYTYVSMCDIYGDKVICSIFAIEIYEKYNII